jgi:hypothetical protein
MKITEPLRMIC